MGTILVVEDDLKLADLVGSFLRKHGFVVELQHRGDEAVAHVLRLRPDLVVLDLMLPGLDGLSVCRDLRRHWEGPVLMLTARGDDMDEIIGLEVGADDYMAKPVRPRVLLARAQALMRRSRAGGPSVPRDLSIGALTISASRRAVEVDGEPVELSTAEFDLLWYLAERAGTPVERESLYRDLRGIEWDGLDRSIDLRVSRVRRKLGERGDLIKSVRGAGYLLASES